MFQFLLHQDFGRTLRERGWSDRQCFSSFFIRTSAGQKGARSIPLRKVSVPSSSGLRPDATARRVNGSSSFSSFFIRTSAGHTRATRTPQMSFQFLLHQDFGRTPRARSPVTPTMFQFLLHQDFGRTAACNSSRAGHGFSSFFIRTSAGPRRRSSRPVSMFQFLLHQDFGRTADPENTF